MSEQPPVRIQVLDGFRAVAILLVIGFHWFVRWAPPWSNTGTQPWGDVLADVWILQYGRSHACFFFILSGFVILLTLERCRSFPDFFRKRVARLWPTLVVCALLTTAILYAVGKSEWTRGPASIVLSTLMIDPAVFKPCSPTPTSAGSTAPTGPWPSRRGSTSWWGSSTWSAASCSCRSGSACRPFPSRWARPGWPASRRWSRCGLC